MEEVVEILPVQITVNDQGETVLSLIVVDREGRRWAGYAVLHSEESLEEAALRAVKNALRMKERLSRSSSESESRPKPSATSLPSIREEGEEAEASGSSPSTREEGEEEKRRKALHYIGEAWRALEARGVDPTKVLGKTLKNLEGESLESLREVYRTLRSKLK